MKRDAVKRIADAVMDEIERGNLTKSLSRSGIEQAVSGAWDAAHAVEIKNIGDDAMRDASMAARQAAYVARLATGGV